MRRLLLAVSVVGLCVTSGFADDSAKAIVDKAIKAHGGLEKLKKYETGSLHIKGKGKLFVMGLELDITHEVFMQSEDKFKTVDQFEVNGMQFTQTTVMKGNDLWIKLNDMDLSGMLDDEMKKDIKEQVQQEMLAGLVFLKKKDVTLSLIGEAQVENKPAVGVKASTKGGRDVNLYFDKASGLLVKTEGRAKDPQTKNEITQVKLLGDYKNENGVMRPKKVTILRDGNKFLDLEILETKFVEKFDDSTFDKP